MPKPRYHAALSIGLAALVVARTRRWRAAIPILVAGVLVDVDHVVDLWVNRRGDRLKWTILPLHAWEWVLALLVGRTAHTNQLAGGLAAHLALDQLNHAISHPLFYWITFRAMHGFQVRRPLVDPERYGRGSRWMGQQPSDWF